MTRPDDYWLDASLEEILGGKTPPDLSDAILARLATRKTETTEQPAEKAELPRVVIGNPPSALHRRIRRRRRALPMAAATLAGCLAIAAAASVWWTGGWGKDSTNGPGAIAENQAPGGTGASSPGENAVAASGQDEGHPPQGIDLGEGPLFAQGVPSLERNNSWQASLPPRQTDQAIVAELNERFGQLWDQAGLDVDSVDPGQWLQRACLAVLGRSPNRQDRQLWESPAVNRSPAAFVDQLLGSQYADQAAEFWGEKLADRLLGPAESSQRTMLADLLRSQLARNRAYDQLLVQLITATGTDDPEDTEFNPAVTFLIADEDSDRHGLTGRTARAILGIRLDCARCHDDAQSGWPQRSYWELNAFFRGMVARQGEDGHWRVSSQPKGQAIDDVFFRRPDDTLAVAYPRLLDRPPRGLPSGWPAATRRQMLALELIASAEVARAAVDWMWQEVFQRPLSELGAPSSQEDLLGLLADQWRAGGYEWKRPLRWMLLSRPLAAPASPVEGPADSVFARFSPAAAAPAMSPETSLRILANLSGASAQPGGIAASFLPSTDPATASNSGQDGGSQPSSQSIVEWLREMPGRERLMPEQREFLQRIGVAQLSPDQRIEHLFEYLLGRRPTPAELDASRRVAGSNSNNPATLEMIAAALVDGPERRE